VPNLVLTPRLAEANRPKALCIVAASPREGAAVLPAVIPRDAVLCSPTDVEDALLTAIVLKADAAEPRVLSAVFPKPRRTEAAKPRVGLAVRAVWIALEAVATKPREVTADKPKPLSAWATSPRLVTEERATAIALETVRADPKLAAEERATPMALEALVTRP
jgi:hypothetical protein